MKNRDQNGRRSRAGYSLVEVTLALLVVAIGLTATFALFPEGLKATRAAVNDTEMALFAEYVFTTLDLTAGLEGSGWTIQDTDLFKSAALAQTGDQGRFQLETGKQATFYWVPNYYGLGGGTYAAANFKDFWTSAFTYRLDIINGGWKVGSPNAPGMVKSAVLQVWPGEYVDGVDPSGEPRTFYREILPFR
jgi:hypothetical protein